MKTTVIYCRVSTDNQDLERQKLDINRYCENNQHTIIREPFEEKITGKQKKRPLIDEMLTYIQTNNVKYLVVSELSRLGRTGEVVEIIETLNSRGVCVISLKENLKTLNDDGSINSTSNLIISILSGINTFELSTINYRTKSGLHRSAMNGIFSGVLLNYGYTKDGKKMVIDSEESEVIRKMFELSINGLGAKRICNYLNENNIPTRFNKAFNKKMIINGIEKDSKNVRWISGTVNTILKNTIYIGQKKFKGEIIHLPQLRIIDDETFLTVQNNLKVNNSKMNLKKVHFYVLDNIDIKCGVCGKNYFPVKKSTGYDNRYVCNSVRYDGSCGNVGVNIDKLVDSIWFIIKKTDDLQHRIDKSLEKTDIRIKINSKNNELDLLTNDIKKVSITESKLLDLYLSDNINKVLYEQRIKGIMTEKKKLENEIEELTKQIQDLTNFEKSQTNLSTLLRNIKIDPHSMKDYISQIVKNVTILPVNNNPVTNTKDVCVLVRLQLYSSLEPIEYVITRRTNHILRLIKGEYKDRMIISKITPERIKPLFRLNTLKE